MKKIKKYPNGGAPQPAWNAPSNLFSAPTVPVFGMQNPNDTTPNEYEPIIPKQDNRAEAALYKQWQDALNTGKTSYTSFEEYKAVMNEDPNGVPSLGLKGFHDVNIKPVAAPKTTTEYSTIKNYSYTPYAAPIAGLNAMVNFAGGLYNNQQSKQEEAQNNFLIQQPQASYFNKRMLKGDKAMYAAYGGELENKETSFLEFMNGGLVSPSMELGGPKPIYTSNKKDPRLKAYNDSMSHYKNYINAKKAVTNEYPFKEYEDMDKFRNRVEPMSPSNYNVNRDFKGQKEFGKPETYYPNNYNGIDGYETIIHKYDKPVQPVKYKKPEQTTPPVFTETPTPLNPNAPQQRTTGIPFLAPETTTPVTPTAPVNNTPTPPRGTQINYSYEGENKINMGGKYYTQAEFDKYFADNKTKLRIIPKANSVGKVYVPGKGIVDYKNYSASMLGYGKGGAVLKSKYEEGGEYEISEAEYKRLLKLGYEVE